MLSALPRYRDEGVPFEAFVYSIAARKLADVHRAAGRRATPVADVPDGIDLTDGPEAMAVRSSDADLAREPAADAARPAARDPAAAGGRRPVGRGDRPRVEPEPRRGSSRSAPRPAPAAGERRDDESTCASSRPTRPTSAREASRPRRRRASSTGRAASAHRLVRTDGRWGDEHLPLRRRGPLRGRVLAHRAVRDRRAARRDGRPRLVVRRAARAAGPAPASRTGRSSCCAPSPRASTPRSPTSATSTLELLDQLAALDGPTIDDLGLDDLAGYDQLDDLDWSTALDRPGAAGTAALLRFAPRDAELVRGDGSPPLRTEAPSGGSPAGRCPGTCHARTGSSRRLPER